MLSRRSFIGKLAAGAAGAAVAVAGGAAAATAATARTDVMGPPGSGHDAAGLAPRGPAPQMGADAPVAAVTDASAAPPAPPPWGLLRPLGVGAVVAHGWRVADLSPVVDGACVLTLQNRRGRTHRIHLCRNDGRPQGIVYTQRLDLVVMNGGQGDLPTDEGLAQAVAQVAHVLAVNEKSSRHAPLVTALLPQEERVRQFAAAVGGKLR